MPSLLTRIRRFKSSFVEQLVLALICLLLGAILNGLLKVNVGYGLVAFVCIALVLFVLYRQASSLGRIADVMARVVEERGGEVEYFDDPRSLYDAGVDMLVDTKREILVYNDHFGQ